jgi:nucleoside-diphosphate-sugar epimerase
MLWAISGGAGFLGLHLARQLLATGHDVRTLDVAPLDHQELERAVDEVRGDIRDAAAAARLARGADVLVHAAAALPIRGSGREIESVNVDGTRTVLEAAAHAGVARAIAISSTAVYGVPTMHPIIEDAPLEGVGHYGRSKIEAEHVASSLGGTAGPEVVILRPKTFLGPERLGVFQILFDWIREGRRVPILGDGSNRYQLLDVDDLAAAVLLAGTKPVAGETLNIGATEFGTVRSDLEALIDHARSTSSLRPGPARPAELALRALELAHLSPLAEWHYKTAHRDSYVDVSRAQRLLGWQPSHSNAQTLVRAWDWYLANRDHMGAAGTTHRVPWNQRALGLLRRLS